MQAIASAEIALHSKRRAAGCQLHKQGKMMNTYYGYFYYFTSPDGSVPDRSE